MRVRACRPQLPSLHLSSGAVVRLLKLGLVVLALAWGHRLWRQHDPVRAAQFTQWAKTEGGAWFGRARDMALTKLDGFMNQVGAGKALAQPPEPEGDGAIATDVTWGSDGSVSSKVYGVNQYGEQIPVMGGPKPPLESARPENWASGATPQREQAYDSRAVPRPWIKYPSTATPGAEATATDSTQQPDARYPTTGYPTTDYPTTNYPTTSGDTNPANSVSRSAIASQRPVQNAQPEPLPWKTFPYESTKILGHVGGEWILAGDIMGSVNSDLYTALKDAPREQLSQGTAQIEAFRKNLIKGHLKSIVDARILVADCKRKVPEENMEKIRAELSSQFAKTQLKEMMKEANVKTAQELDAHLRATGTTLEREKRTYMDFSLAQGWVRQNTSSTTIVSHDELLSYYESHIAEFEFPAKAKWEQVSVKLVHYSTKQQAYSVAAEMGNRILQGAPFEEAAKIGPLNAYSTTDWTTKGSLVSTVIDDAIFRLPIGQLSPILEDERGFHIVRVTEREDMHRTPFRDAQVGIKKSIIEQRDKEARQQFVDKAREKIEVSTIFDQEEKIGRNPPAKDAASVYR